MLTDDQSCHQWTVSALRGLLEEPLTPPRFYQASTISTVLALTWQHLPAPLRRWLLFQTRRVNADVPMKRETGMSAVLHVVLAFACCSSGARRTLVEAFRSGESLIRLSG
jgi:hypothetical protein